MFLCASSLPEFIQMLINFDNCRRKWCTVEEELNSCNQVLAELQTERGALEVKLKHARNQVDVEIQRRQKAEAHCEKLVCWGKGSCSIWPHWLYVFYTDLCLNHIISHLSTVCFSVVQERQIQLMRDLLFSEGSSNSIQLNEEQRSSLAFLSTRSQAQAEPNLNTSPRWATHTHTLILQ